jgi:hypothetical protein
MRVALLRAKDFVNHLCEIVLQEKLRSTRMRTQTNATSDLPPSLWRRVQFGLRTALTPIIGAALILFAVLAIEYQEHMAPNVDRMVDTWSSAAGDTARSVHALARPLLSRLGA